MNAATIAVIWGGIGLIIYASVINLGGTPLPQSPPRAPSTETLKMYKCSEEELIRVQTEFDICIRTNYTSDECFSTAKATQCQEIL